MTSRVWHDPWSFVRKMEGFWASLLYRSTVTEWRGLGGPQQYDRRRVLVHPSLVVGGWRQEKKLRDERTVGCFRSSTRSIELRSKGQSKVTSTFVNDSIPTGTLILQVKYTEFSEKDVRKQRRSSKFLFKPRFRLSYEEGKPHRRLYIRTRFYTLTLKDRRTQSSWPCPTSFHSPLETDYEVL